MYKRFLARRERFGQLVFDKHNGDIFVIKDAILPISKNLQLKKGKEIHNIIESDIHFFDSKISQNDDILSGPTYVEIYPTLFCNERCTFCYVGHVLTSKMTAMSREIVDATVSKLKNLGVFGISILGGEPFLYKDLDYLISELARQNFAITISTNGAVFNPTLYDKFIDLGVKISVSLHSHIPEVSNSIVKNPVAFKKTLESIRHMSKRGSPPHITIVLNSINRGHINEMIEFLCKEGIKGISLFHTMDSGFAKQNLREGVAFNEYISIFNSAREIAERNGSRLTVTTNFPFLVDDRLKFNPKPEFANLLYGTLEGRRSLYINYNGDIFPSAYDFNAPELKLGNILYSDLSQIWFTSPILSQFRKAVTRIECASCKHFEYCRGGPITNYNIHYFNKSHKAIVCPLFNSTSLE